MGFVFRTGKRYPAMMLTGIRNRILVFAILATLLPSLVLGWMYFQQSRQALLDNTAREMKAVASQAEREILLWLKEQLFELRVFSGSYLLSEALESYRQPRAAEDVRSEEVVNSLGSYLSLVRDQYSYYRKLLVFDNDGQLIVHEPLDEPGALLPPDWLAQLGEKRAVLGDFHREGSDGQPALMLGVPVASANDGMLGVLAVEVQPLELEKTLYSLLSESENRGSGTRLMLVDARGMVVLDAAGGSEDETGRKWRVPFPRNDVRDLIRYRNSQGKDVVGLLLPVSGSSWAVLMEKPRDYLFAHIERTRNMAVLVVAGIVAMIGGIAWLLAREIIAPLGELTAAAREVAKGNLDVSIRVRRKDELGFASTVFNDMVGQLRYSRERLEKLSTTDFLTGLPNRAAILDALSGMLKRYQRYSRVFSLLMIDVDHFKSINDKYGHVAGDEVLRHLASMLREQMREVDVIGRYGGEEFIALLDETDGESALVVAERLRTEIAALGIDIQGNPTHITVSIGIAEAEQEDKSADGLIDRADKAMYLAKQNGRNRAELAGVSRRDS